MWLITVSEPWWHKPEWVTGLATAAATAALVVLGIIKYIHKRRERQLRICKAQNFNPNEIVAGFRARGFSEYMPIPADNETWRALLNGESIGLRGRPGIGKSHSAAHHIRKLGISARGGKHLVSWLPLKILSALKIPGFGRFSDWYVIRPPLQVLPVANQVRVRKRRYILLLDDLNDYVRNDDGAAVLDLIGTLLSQAKQLVIISTLRSTAPEDVSVNAVSKIFARWRWIDLPDWRFDQGQELAQNCRTGVDKWDGTPLSVKQPSSEMGRKYDLLEYPAAKAILRCLLLFRKYGLYSVSRLVLKRACATELFNVDPSEFEKGLTIVGRFGFLKTGAVFIEAYEPYLDTIHDWGPSAHDYPILRDLLVAERHLPELMAIAAWWYGQEEFSEAEWISRKCIELAPRKPSYYLWLGSILWKKHDLRGAESALITALDLNHNYSRARSLLAGTWAKLGRTEDAEKAYQRVLQAAPEMFEAVIGFGIVLLQKGDLAEAKNQFLKAIKIRPDSSRAHCFLGETFWRLNRPWEAEESYRKATELNSELFEARVGYARLLLEKRDYATAARQAQEAARLMPNSAWAHSLLGQAFRDLGKLEDAEGSYRVAVSVDPDCIDYKVGLGIVLLAKSDYLAARDVFSEVVESDPTFWRGHSYLAEAFAMLGNFDEAERSYLRASKIDPGKTEPLTGLGMTLLKKGDFFGAEDAFRKALEIKPDKWVYARLGDALHRQGKLDEAEEMYTKGLSAEPEILRQRFRHGVFWLRKGDVGRAEIAFRDVLKFNPHDLQTYSRLAEALIRQGKDADLRELQDRMVALNPKDPVIYLGPGMSALNCSNWMAAAYFFQKAIDLDPKYARAYQHLGHALLSLGRRDDAEKVLREAVRLNPQMSKAHYVLGRTLLEKGDLRKAEDALRKSIDIKGTFAEAHQLLGEILERRGRNKEAIDEYKRAADLNASLAVEGRAPTGL